MNLDRRVSDHCEVSLQFNDREVQHIVDLIAQQDIERIHRWTHVCDSVYVADYNGNSLLHWAASLGFIPAINLFLDLGLPLEARNNNSATAILAAAASAPNVGSVLLLLVDRGANITATNRNGDSVCAILKKRKMYNLAAMFECLFLEITDHEHHFLPVVADDRVTQLDVRRTDTIGCAPMDDRAGSVKEEHSHNQLARIEKHLADDAAWWALQHSMEILQLEETSGRVTLENLYYETCCFYFSGIVDRTIVDVVRLDSVLVNILGEKCENGEVFLLAEMKGQKDPQWVPLALVRQLRRVQEYLEFSEASQLTDVLDIEDSTGTPVTERVLNSVERDELEAQLRSLKKNRNVLFGSRRGTPPPCPEPTISFIDTSDISENRTRDVQKSPQDLFQSDIVTPFEIKITKEPTTELRRLLTKPRKRRNYSLMVEDVREGDSVDIDYLEKKRFESQKMGSLLAKFDQDGPPIKANLIRSVHCYVRE